MDDLITPGPFTAFDAIAAVLILFSALMAFARGFIRELASIGAFVAGLLVAYLVWANFSGTARAMMPDGWPGWVADVVIVVAAFLAVYIVTAWLGARFSRLVHSTTDIGILDRLAGMVFGAVRGAVVIIAVLLAARPFVEEAQIGWIVEARSYPLFVAGVEWVQANVPALASEVQESLPPPPDDSL